MSTGEQSSPGPSKRKELLAALVDGLDVLVGMEEGKKEREKREEEAPQTPDTFSGLLQSFIPLMIIPQLLPLFQQALGQTLSSTTVTVKVESATSIIPIDISASTAIVPIEIRASQVTLNVNIASQTTTLNVTITGDANVVITGQVVDIRLSGFWHAVSGLQKRFFIQANLFKQLELETQLTYTVPSGRRLVITDVKVNIGLSSYVATGSIRRRYPSTGWDPVAQVPGHTVEIYIYRGFTLIYGLSTSIYQPKVSDALPTPLVFTAGQQLRVATLTNVIGTFVIIELNGYEETV